MGKSECPLLCLGTCVWVGDSMLKTKNEVTLALTGAISISATAGVYKFTATACSGSVRFETGYMVI